MERIIVFLTAFINIIVTAHEGISLPAAIPEYCKSDEYFDPVCVTCGKCGRTSEEQGFQTLHDGICQCRPRYYLHERIDHNSITCKPCPDEKVTSLDDRSCISCANDSFNATLGTCEPCINGIVVEEDNVQSCIPCRKGTIFDKRSGRCVSCPKGFMADVGKCVCANNTKSSGGLCLPEGNNLDSLFNVNFESGVVKRSAFFVEHIRAVLYNCKEKNNGTACQVLANMCVMLQYRLTVLEENACSEFFTYAKKHHADCRTDGKTFGPQLFYISDDTKSELFKTNVPFTYSSDPESRASRLKIIAMKYNVNGTVRGVSYLQSVELQLCKNYVNGDDLPFIFGTRVEKKCEVFLRDIWDESELVFYDLFLVGDVKGNQSEMYPIPVLIRSIIKNGEPVNKNADVSRWQLVRRFFLTDPVSGIQDSSMVIQDRRQPFAEIFRYAAEITLRIKLKKEGSPGSIYPPLLIITHAEATPKDYMKNVRVPVTFTVSYEMDQSESDQAIAISIGVLSALAFLWSSLQTWSWLRRSGKHAVDVLILGKFLIFICGNLATVFFIVVFCACLNWFIVFKNQDVVHLLLPVPDQEKFLSVYISIAFVMKALHVIHILVVQCTADVFFIDWERPRIKASASSRPSAKTSESAASNSGGKAGNESNSKLISDKIPAEAPAVSIWRTYFVANEWAEIQSLRKISLSLQLFGTLFFLKVVGFESSALASPTLKLPLSEAIVNVPYSACCRFVIGAGVFLCMASVQVVVRKLIYERFVEDKLQQYVDLCSVSNVSVFVMVTKRYGYYIHGRSAHGRADVNMKEMHELLRREEEDLCGHRGLLPNTEQQTFQMALPVGVHDQFQRLLVPLTSYSQAADRMQGVGGNLTKVDIDRVVNTYQMLNKFLSGFIEHAFKDLDYIVKDKVMLESLFDIECYEVADRGYFYNDNGHSFDSVLLFGNESTLLIFDVLLFSVIDIATSDYILAAVLTFFIGKAVQAIRQSAGRRNLVRKALVDERFLT